MQVPSRKKSKAQMDKTSAATSSVRRRGPPIVQRSNTFNRSVSIRKRVMTGNVSNCSSEFDSDSHYYSEEPAKKQENYQDKDMSMFLKTEEFDIFTEEVKKYQ